MNVGFTGTRRGMTAEQHESVTALLERLLGERGSFHHGDCVGADDQAAETAKQLGFVVYAHPASDVAKEYVAHSWVRLGTVRNLAAPALQRNRNIVDACDVLVAAPGSMARLRSGTWATIRYAQKVGRRVIVVEKDGQTFDKARREEER